MCFLHECTCMILLETQRKIRQRMEMAKVSIIPGILGVMKRPLSTLYGPRKQGRTKSPPRQSFENNRVTNTWRASQPRTEIQTR